MAATRDKTTFDISTNLLGRLRNVELPHSRALFPLFEAVINSLHAIDALNEPTIEHSIVVDIYREARLSLDLKMPRRGPPFLENIAGFRITDNGIGFDEANWNSFLTLDSQYKASLGCRGVGRLLWLKAFDKVTVRSIFFDDAKSCMQRDFELTSEGVMNATIKSVDEQEKTTVVHLQGFKREYRDAAPKGNQTIAAALLEHCLWYFLRPGQRSSIRINDGDDTFNLDTLYDELVLTSTSSSIVSVKGKYFNISHIQFRGSRTSNELSWCANDRVVVEEKIDGKVPGLHGRITDSNGLNFTYACFVTSSYLDEKVRPERIGFNIPETAGDLLDQSILSLSEIRGAVLKSSSEYLASHLENSRRAGLERVNTFLKHNPRYRPIFSYIPQEELYVDPAAPDKDLDILFHRNYVLVERSMIEEGHQILHISKNEDFPKFEKRLEDFLAKLADFKASDLASYVAHRAMVIEFLSQSLRKNEDNKYERESVIHEILIPMRKTSDEIRFEDSNLWLLDERLAFHEFLASDKDLSSYEILTTEEKDRPDVAIVNVADTPLLFAEHEDGPIATISIIEIKRPMRADLGHRDEDPVKQCLDYLEKIRNGKAKTRYGRPIPNAEAIPGFCYIVCDATDGIKDIARRHSLKITSDSLGYFGYHEGYNAYIEIMTFPRMIQSARERHKAFFDKIGLPSRSNSL